MQSRIVQTALYGLRPVEYLSWRARREGDGFLVRLPFGDTTMFTDPIAIKEIFALGVDDFRTADSAPLLEPFVGRRSVLMLDGERHRAERRVMVQSLHGESLSTHADAIVDATRRDVATWPRGRPFALHPHMQSITLDVMLRLVFGAEEGAVHAEFKDVLQPWLEQAGSLLVLAPFLRHELRGWSPWGRFVGHRRRYDEVVDRHIERLRADPRLDERTDALSRLVPHLDDEALHDELLTMLAAGHDTSATTLSWAFDLLLHHPAALARAREGEDDYLEAVVKETLRLRPAVLDVGRTLTEDTVVGGRQLRAGSTASACILLAQRRADRYEDPLDFRPERFLGRPADPHSWLPFGGGIRRCIGAQLATMEVKTVLRTVLQEVELQPATPKLERAKRRAVTMIPARGARAICQSLAASGGPNMPSIST